MNIYIVFEKESGSAVSTRYVDEEDKEILNDLKIPTAVYDEDNPRVNPPCDITLRLPFTRAEAAQLFGCVIMDIDPETKLPRSI